MTTCPVCHHDNFAGEDLCEECGADLTAVDLPQDAIDFHGRLLGEHLDVLGVKPPLTVPATMALDEAIGLMHAGPVDCLLVMDGDKLAGIFTDRDAVVRTTGIRLSSFLVRDFMTRDPVVLRHDETIAIAIVSSWRRTTGSRVMKSRTRNELRRMPVVRTTASRSVKMPASLSPSITKRQSTGPACIRPIASSRAIVAGTVSGGLTPRTSRCSPSSRPWKSIASWGRSTAVRSAPHSSHRSS